MSVAAEDYYRLRWAHGELTVRAIGGMIAPVDFELGDGRRISPLHVAPWAGEAASGDDGSDGGEALPPLLAGLRGEWPCLPYGPARIPANLPAGWQAQAPHDAWDHGYCANHRWQLVEQSATQLVLAIDLPDSEAVARLERRIRVDPDAPSISVELRITARRDARLPFALHPTFVVPEEGVDIVGGGYGAVHTYPMPAEPGVSRLQPNRCAPSLAALPVDGGGTLDLTHLPLPFKTEELLQLADCRPPFVLRYAAAGAEVVLDWDVAELPDALLWISNGGRAQAPWSGRHYALGIEPDNSCFDLTRVATPPADHPLATRRGIALEAGRELRIAYRLSARPIAAPAGA